ncbi:hypothetical protein SAMN05216191_119101 [Paenibacillus jilunlii]|uniref:Uncharacterized protein n=1 Tax=Paenibacillus jilunlii TaxID=682956 RepID=A0A1G9WK92_9BACL|nr:hypothetical protein SAMN05216191_119101 [Paenibacillus jilunlii]
MLKTLFSLFTKSDSKLPLRNAQTSKPKVASTRIGYEVRLIPGTCCELSIPITYSYFMAALAIPDTARDQYRRPH